MGTDYVQLFDKRLCDEIRTLNEQGLEMLISARWKHLENSVIHSIYQVGTPMDLHVKALLSSAFTPASLRKELIFTLCFGKKMLYLDYWACYMEVFLSNPTGSISFLDIFPDEQEEILLLLLPEHVDQMLAGLNEHRDELRVMNAADIAELKFWNDRCRADPGMMIAYIFD